MICTEWDWNVDDETTDIEKIPTVTEWCEISLESDNETDKASENDTHSKFASPAKTVDTATKLHSSQVFHGRWEEAVVSNSPLCCCIFDVYQGSQTRGPHVAREGVLCSPRFFLGIFKL